MKIKHPLHVTERDLDALSHLGDYRFLTHHQLAHLGFPSAEAARRRMTDLVIAKLAVKVFVPVRPYSFKAEDVYALSKRGATLLQSYRGVRLPHLPEHERRSGLFLDHTLRRNDVRLTLLALDRTVPTFRLGRWRQMRDDVRSTVELELRRGLRERVTIVPDGVAELMVDREPHVLAIEVDMGTVSLKRMFTKYRAYHEAWRSGLTRARHGRSAYRVLTLTTNARRLAGLRECARDSPGRARGSQLFWFGLLEVANPGEPQRLLEPVFEVATATPTPPRCLLTNKTMSYEIATAPRRLAATTLDTPGVRRAGDVPTGPSRGTTTQDQHEPGSDEGPAD